LGDEIQSLAGLRLALQASQRSSAPTFHTLPNNLDGSVDTLVKARQKENPTESKFQAFAAVCRQLNALGPDPAGLWPLLFLEFCRHLSETDANDFAVALANENGPASRSATMTLGLTAALARHEKDSDDVSAQEALNAFVPTVQSMIPGFQAHWLDRVFFLPNDYRHEKLSMPPALMDLYIADMQKALARGETFHDGRLFSYLLAFSRGKYSTSWQKTARAVVELRLSSKDSVNFSPAGKLPQGHIDDLGLLLVMTALCADDLPLAQRVITAQPYLADQVGLYAVLIMYGANAQAQQLLHEHLKTLTGQSLGMTWNAELAKCLPAFLDGIKNPTERLFIDVLLNALPDESGVDANERLEKFVSKTEVSTGNSRVDLLILASLADETLFLPRLLPRLKVWSENLDLATLKEEDDNLTPIRRKLLALYLQSESAAGRTELLERVLKQFPGPKDESAQSNPTQDWVQRLKELHLPAKKKD
jgi:hypothetical protein